jgi:EpsI family protein
MSRYLLLLVVGAILLVDGYVYGLWAGRWHITNELAEAVASLDRVPLKVGDWQGTPLELEPRAVQRAEFSGYLLRRYENQRTGAAVKVLVACGRPGPLSLHTPEICYPGAGLRMLAGEAARQTLDARFGPIPAEIMKATFARENATSPEQQRVVWSWHGKSGWTAPNNPRWEFAGQPVLYKMYVTQEFFPRNEETDAEGCLQFLGEFLPELDKVIVANR